MGNLAKKKIYLIIAVLIAALAGAGIFALLRLMNDTDFIVKRSAEEIRQDEPRELSFSYGKRDDVKRLPAFFFTPDESGEYRFSVTDIVNDSTAGMGLYVANEDFTDYLVLDNYAAEETGGIPEDLEGDAFLEKGQKYYIMTVVIGTEDTEAFDGSVTINVSLRPDEEPEELKVNDSVILSIKADGQSCALFHPEESSYYRFDTVITTEDASMGFSSVASVSSDDDAKIPLTEGIAWLEAGKEYHVWAEVSETETGTSEVMLSSRKMETMQASGTCELEINGDTLIEYHAEGDEYLAVYSVSEGDPAGLIYEKPGFALRTDDNNSQKLFSENGKDFAMVFKAEKGSDYRIGVYGSTRKCKVIIELYKAEEESEESGSEESETEESGEDSGSSDS